MCLFKRLRTLTETLKSQGDKFIETLVNKTDEKSKTFRGKGQDCKKAFGYW